ALPLQRWCDELRSAGIPTVVSHHAGTYLCNAALYFSHLFADMYGYSTRSGFVHLPLSPAQVASRQQRGQEDALASMSVPMMATAIATMVRSIV
ncbi:MAG: pyroglutamyl-peptidase I, partial [Planctomycetota bacterium]